MNVSDLQRFLNGLSDSLCAVGASRAAQDLDRVCGGLKPFRDLSIAQLADFLQRAEEYARTGIVRTKGRGRGGSSRAVDPEAVQEAIRHMRDLYEGASRPEVGYALIDAEVRNLSDSFTKAPVLEIAKGMGISGTFRTKKAALEEIRRKITERKESHQRTQF